VHAADVNQEKLLDYLGPQKMIMVDTELKLKAAGKIERAELFRCMYDIQCEDFANKVGSYCSYTVRSESHCVLVTATLILTTKSTYHTVHRNFMNALYMKSVIY
jgi:hypothetical protein